MDLGIRGKVALVTGGSRGIGRGVAAALAAEGAHVAIAARSSAGVETAAKALGQRGYVFDSDDLDSIPQLLADVERDLGPVEIYVANTGGPPANADTFAFSRGDWEMAHRRLVLSPLEFLKHLLPAMRRRRWGRVVAVGSYAVREPIDFLQLSNAHRPGLVAVFKTLARQHAAEGVTLNHVHPGQIATERMLAIAGSKEFQPSLQELPSGRLGTVEEVAAAVTFLCSDLASYISGTSVYVDGAATRSLS